MARTRRLFALVLGFASVALAMGFSWIRLDGARVLEDAVVVRMVASDDDSKDTPDEEGPSVSTPLESASGGF
jgi:hypothetical protein